MLEETEPIEWPEVPDIFAPSAVGAELLAAMRMLAAEYSSREIRRYDRDYDRVQLNWEQQGKKFPLPAPPVEFYFTEEEGYAHLASRAVAGYPKPAPWADLNPPETPEGFGPPVPGIPGAFWVIGYVPAGSEVERDGKRYKCIQIPLMQYWFPVG